MTVTKLCYRLSYDDFLSLENPTGISVSPDDTRSNFFRHLGMSEHNLRHKSLYQRMKLEALDGMHRLFATRDCLQPELINDPNVNIPYSPEQITEVAFQNEVDRIYRLASRQTQGLYDVFRTPGGGNWVIRWMLWRLVQKRQRVKQQASASSAYTEALMPSHYLRRSDHDNLRSVQGSRKCSSLSHPCAVLSSPSWECAHEDDWEEPPRKAIKLDPEISKSKRLCRSRLYWSHVLNP